jgi:hypothetical protein
MTAFDPISSWFENGFRIRQQKAAKVSQGKRRDKVRSGGGGSPKPRGGSGAAGGGSRLSASAKSKNVSSVARKAPEVMVKITGSSKGLATVKNHLDYISRNGKVELVNEAGESIHGTAAVRDLKQHLKAEQIPEDGKKREFLHVVFSMPKETPTEDMKAAVAAFCKDEFSNRRYVMAFHDDTAHKHVHLCVGTRDIERVDEPRLSPRKADLFAWRVGFAEKLRDLGIDAAASPRQARFQHQKSENRVVRIISAEDPKSPHFNKEQYAKKSYKLIAKAATNPQRSASGELLPPPRPTPRKLINKALNESLAANSRPTNPAQERIEAKRIEAVKKWGAVLDDLLKSGDDSTAKLVKAIIDDGEKPITSRLQDAFDKTQAEKSNAQNRDSDLSV